MAELLTDSVGAVEGRPVRRRSRLLAAVLTGAYAWSLTVLPPMLAHGFTSLVGVFGALALAALLVSPFVPPGRWALLCSLDLFVGFSLLSWWAGTFGLTLPPFAIFGTFGWLAYTLALGALSTPEEVDGPLDPGPQLEARTRPSRLSAVVLGLIFVAVLVLLGAAWRIDRPAIAALGHIVALAIVLLVLRTGARLSTHLQVAGTKLARPLSFRRALFPFLLLILLGVLAAVRWYSGR